MGKTIESHDLNAKLHVPVKFFFSTFVKMATLDSVHIGIHAHRHVCALHVRVATTVSAMNAKGCAGWCHVRRTVRRAVSLKRKILSQPRPHSARASWRTKLQEACTRT